MDALVLLFVVAAALIGVGIGWVLGNRPVAEARAEREALNAKFLKAVSDLATASERADKSQGLQTALEAMRDERDEAMRRLVQLETEAAAFEARLAEVREAKEQLSAQFAQISNRLLAEAQDQFLKRADARFAQAGETNEARLKALLQPVEATLKRYEANVEKVENERKAEYGNLTGLIDAMRAGQESVRAEAAKLVNALRAAPKARGRWGEQQLRNVLESCGLSEHTDFLMEVSVAAESGRLRPDAVVRIPGGKSLVIDAKVSLNAWQDAHGAGDDAEKAAHLAAHVASMKGHINALGSKDYQSQFEDAPDYVIMFVPGEHFLSAALEHDSTLWDYAFARRVLIATPTNLIAIARTVAAVWRQELLAGQAREIAALGRELHSRLATMGGHVARLGKNLETATGAYNAFVGSLESQVMTSARRFEALNIETGGKSIDPLPMVEASPRPLAKLATPADPDGQAEAAE